jgi:hypothetical protein
MFLSFYSARAAAEYRLQDLLAQVGGYGIAAIVVVTALILFWRAPRRDWLTFACLLVCGVSQIVMASSESTMNTNVKAALWFILILLQLTMASILCNGPNRRYSWPIYGATLLLGLHWGFASLRGGGVPMDDDYEAAMEDITYTSIGVIMVVAMAAFIAIAVVIVVKTRRTKASS